MPIAKKLYPPTLSKIPAFCGKILTVPFTMNRSVHKSEVKGFAIIVKNILSDTLLINALSASSWDFDKMEAYFDVSKVNMVVGEYYKVQLAYIGQAGIGYYSSVASVKCTSKPTVTIAGLEKYSSNLHMFHYVGEYSQKGMDLDTTEKVYSYHFNIYDSNEKLIATSGELIHNGLEDTEYYSSIDTFDFPQDLNAEDTYYIQYTVKTNNGLIVSSPRYKLIQHNSVDSEMQAELLVENKFDNGYILLSLQGQVDEEGLETAATGNFVVSRANYLDNYMTWNEIAKFSLQGQSPSCWSWKDFTTEQGVTYQYSVQQYNTAGIYSNRILSKQIRADFEDAFLYDGKRQLKVKFNPKVDTFKSDLQEAKQETIGSKYPFIFRNGNINYKEFSLSSLLSYFSDEEELFLTKEDIQFEGYTIDLITGNLYSERLFKLKAYEWLTDGKPKLFRSPGEGNYIVRLVNVTMSPQNPVGRMLHSFSCSAYEIADCSFDNLEAYSFIQLDSTDEDDETSLIEKQMRWETIELWRLDESDEDIVLNKHPAIMAEFVNMVPGEQIIVDGVTVTIGSTGGYLLNNIHDEISELKLPAKGHGSGYLTYGYYATKEVLFDTITDFELIDIADRQFIGEHNILDEIVDTRTSIERWHIYNFKLRSITTLYYSGDIANISTLVEENRVYYDFAKKDILTVFSPIDQQMLYELRSLDGETNYFFDPCSNKVFEAESYDPCVYIDGKQISLAETKKYYQKLPDVPATLTQGNGVVGDMSLRVRVTTYRVEDNNTTVKAAKEAWKDSLQTLKNWLFGTAYDLKAILRHWFDDFKPDSEHWSGIGIGCNEELYDDSTYDEKLGFTGALIWTNLDDGLTSHWMKLGADITYTEIGYEEPSLTASDYSWSTCCTILEGEEIPSEYLSGYVLAGVNWTAAEHYLNDTPSGWDKVWVDLTPDEIMGQKPYPTDYRWMQAYTNLEGIILGRYLGDTEIGFWFYDDPTEEELMARRPITKIINGKKETDYVKVMIAQQQEVVDLYKKYLEALDTALAEDEEARKQ